ncbi:MAG: DUF4290 domain-containing protein [Prevotella sp.]|jgi:hypothetical protein|nr:DUF4290 domain-containing protein [Prevotella sp.]
MNIEGLDYNTQREKLVLPEYGREVQSMVDYAVALTNRADRQRCANAIVAIMKRMFPQPAETEGYERKLWDHLALMSDFKLDIDYPYDIEEARTIQSKPAPMPYPMKRIPVRHYGSMMFEIFEKLKELPDGHEREELIRLAANQMKRDLVLWGHGSSDDEKVASDLANFTDGKVQLDLDSFKFDKIEVKEQERRRGRRK